MKNNPGTLKRRYLMIFVIIFSTVSTSFARTDKTDRNIVLEYTVSSPEPENHLFHVELVCMIPEPDTLDFKLPCWMPGYYQMMDYSESIRNFSANTLNGNNIPFQKSDKNTWRIVKQGNTPIVITYDVYSDKRFVAHNFLDTTHGYIVPAATFMYPDGHTDIPVNVKLIPYESWNDIATGLDRIAGKKDEFFAPDFDILYDCPILFGNLEELPSFEINGVTHRFVAYNPGDFDREKFISGLEKTIKAGIDIIGDIPYKEYTFIGIGPGYGGIEHLNNTTVSFNGSGLDKPGALVRTLNFLAHEYFHHYNVKRIRPFELGPFDYGRENRTNLLWVSEGLTVYYEYLMVKRAGLMSDEELFKSIEGNINTIENDPGRQYQSLIQSSYYTWDEGPFGNSKGATDQSISYYDKGPILGLILDFSIRNATQNKQSLDDVMRFLYRHYYKKMKRGFTDAEFQQACEKIAGISLSREFEYANTAKEIDYSTYLSFAGLRVTEVTDNKTGKRKFSITKQDNMTPAQEAIFKSWCGN